MKRYWLAPMVLVLAMTAPGVGQDTQQEEVKLPGPMLWDYKALAEIGTVTKTTYDPNKNEVHWLLKADKDILQINKISRSFAVHFLDADEVRVKEVPLTFTPNGNVKQGQMVRATLRLPPDKILQQSAKAVVVVQK